MTYQPFLIANVRTGLERDLQPWLLPDDAYPNLFNSYLFRGVIYKKGGNILLGRLGIRQQTLVASRGAGNTNVATNLDAPVEPGSIIITDGTTTFTDNGVGGFVITGGTGTVNVPTNYTTGAIDITFTAANPGVAITTEYFMLVGANSPCMGLPNRLIPGTTDETLMGFDLTAGYEYSQIQGKFLHTRFYKGTTNVVAWTGSNSDFFYSTNYQNALFTTNNIPGAHFYVITAITVAAAAQVTTSVANNFAIGDVVTFGSVQGMTQINGLTGTVTAPGNPFTVNINSGGFNPYTGGGVAWSQTHTKTVSASGDGIRWYDGTGWVNFEPPVAESTPAGTPTILMGGLIVLPYKDRLIVLNTWEGTSYASRTNFPQRARYSQVGNVYYGGPLPAGITSVPDGFEWYSTPGRGGFIDAPTAEEIVAAEFIKDTLVVYFENSTWKLTFTGSDALPFVWEKINTEVGAESTFSIVPFDRAILSVGSTGIYQCDSINIERIDRKIPDESFDFHNGAQGAKRVYGIRDFFNEFTYWSFATAENNPTFPNRALAYNYLDGSWSIFKTYYTAYGYFKVISDFTWGSMTIKWEEANVPWNAPALQSGFPVIVGGNQQGFVASLSDVDANNLPNTNDKMLVIQNITNAHPSVITSPNHGFVEGDFVLITDVKGATAINDAIYKVEIPITTNTFTLSDVAGNPVSVAGYTYGGKITIIDNFQITTKRFNPFIGTGRAFRLGFVDLFVQNTTLGQITVDCFVDEDYVNPVDTFAVSTESPNADLVKFWTRIFLNSVGQTVAFQMSYSDAQMFNQDIAEEDVQFHGMMLWASPVGRFNG